MGLLFVAQHTSDTPARCVHGARVPEVPLLLEGVHALHVELLSPSPRPAPPLGARMRTVYARIPDTLARYHEHGLYGDGSQGRIPQTSRPPVRSVKSLHIGPWCEGGCRERRSRYALAAPVIVTSPYRSPLQCADKRPALPAALPHLPLGRGHARSQHQRAPRRARTGSRNGSSSCLPSPHLPPLAFPLRSAATHPRQTSVSRTHRHPSQRRPAPHAAAGRLSIQLHCS